MGGGGEDQILVIVFIVAGLQRAASGLRDENRSAAHEVHDGGHMEDVLIVSSKREDAIGADGTADGAAELLLAVVGLEVEERRLRAERAVANEIKPCAVEVVGS